MKVQKKNLSEKFNRTIFAALLSLLLTLYLLCLIVKSNIATLYIEEAQIFLTPAADKQTVAY